MEYYEFVSFFYLLQRANESYNDLSWSFQEISKYFNRKHSSVIILYREITCRQKCSPLQINFLFNRIPYWIFRLPIVIIDRFMIYFRVDRSSNIFPCRYFLIELNQKKYYGLSSFFYLLPKSIGSYNDLRWSFQ